MLSINTILIFYMNKCALIWPILVSIFPCQLDCAITVQMAGEDNTEMSCSHVIDKKKKKHQNKPSTNHMIHISPPNSSNIFHSPHNPLKLAATLSNI